jgi:hypothetical protein
MGLNPDAGAMVRLPDMDTRMGDVTKRLKMDIANLIGVDKCEQVLELVGQLRGNQDRPPTLCSVPDWATKLEDLRNQLHWDESQYVGHLGINGALVYCILDTGAHRTVIDTKMAAALKLRVRKEPGCGKFSVPGSEAIHEYAGIIEGTTVI